MEGLKPEVTIVHFAPHKQPSEHDVAGRLTVCPVVRNSIEPSIEPILLCQKVREEVRDGAGDFDEGSSDQMGVFGVNRLEIREQC